MNQQTKAELSEAILRNPVLTMAAGYAALNTGSDVVLEDNTNDLSGMTPRELFTHSYKVDEHTHSTDVNEEVEASISEARREYAEAIREVNLARADLARVKELNEKLLI
ncbi:hypothetical protein [Paenibacillus sp. KN14-4R]|uniref:hypothetical protein n=1 Tax=Paenibacillus sp. KN14-4R TaxID=3445773 RepID=UPI003FA04E5C